MIAHEHLCFGMRLMEALEHLCFALRSAPINPATQRDYSVTMSAATDGVRVRAREGEEVEWSTKAARRAGTLKDMMDDAPTENGIYPENGRLPIAAAELTMLGAMCEADDPTPASLDKDMQRNMLYGTYSTCCTAQAMFLWHTARAAVQSVLILPTPLPPVAC